MSLSRRVPDGAGMTVLRSYIHVSVRPNCGICGRSMNCSENCIVLFGNMSSTTFSRRYGSGTFPDYGQRPRQNNISLCRKMNCSTCAESAEASTLHSDCLQFVAQRCKLRCCLDRFWIVTTWRAPWRQAPHFRLEETALTLDSSMCDDIGLPILKLLPPELRLMVHDYSADSLFWRYSAAFELARRLPVTSSSPLMSIPLCTVSEWVRGGGGPVTLAADHQLPIIRLTIDSRGIQKVERLPEHPRFSRWRSDSLLFVVLDQSCLEGVTAQFKFGHLRLDLPETFRGLQTWDTPTPPKLIPRCFCPAEISSITQFKTIDLSQITGITFFFFAGTIYAVHAHTQAAPCAQPTNQTMTLRRQKTIAWVYLPISPKDSIVALGARKTQSQISYVGGTCLLFRFKLGGDVPIGLISPEPSRDLLLGRSPVSLIHDTRELHSVSVIGAHAGGNEDNSSMPEFCCPLIGNPPFSFACFSSAPLKSVSRVSIFNVVETGLCRGILLEYNNGAQRSLGQCRVVVDPVEHHVTPILICFRQTSYLRPKSPVSLQATIVQSTGKCEHNHDEQGWTCVAMRGELQFWFSSEETKLIPMVDTDVEA